MKKSLIILLFGIFTSFTMMAQKTIIKGSVKDAVSFEPIPDVTITIEETQQATLTDGLGEFMFSSDVPLGEQVLRISKTGYETKRYPIVVNEGGVVNITDMTLEIEITGAQDLFTITLSDDELNDDTSGADNISGLLSSSLDVFQRTAAFEFSSSFFRIRGLDSDNGSVLMNGIEMNKMYNGRPQWSNWGGLNDMMRNQVLATGLQASEYNFGGILGTSNIITRASSYRKGSRITYSSSNRSYTNRAMVSYASGLTEGGWSYAFMVGRRWGEEGYQDATLYDSNSFFGSIEKKINDKHSINFTSIYTPNRRGKSSANTQEVYDLKGIQYNEFWGNLDGEQRNSRIKEVEEPILMLNHYWDINSKTTLNTNVGYQFGRVGNSRLDYAGGVNPSPAYYQNLPSYFLEDDDLAGAYEAQQEFINDGQINWERIIDANVTNNISGAHAAYVLYEDRNDDKQLTVNTIFNTELNDNILLNGGINYKRLDSENFAEIIDLLGSTTGALNVDSFSQNQFDLNNPNQVAFEGDKFRYNYNIYANELKGFAQAQFKYNKIDFFVAGSVTKTDYQREGLYKNENQISFIDGAEYDNSFGKGDKLEFTGIGAKAGLTYKITGKHLLNFNGGYMTKAPSIRNTYTNSRESHDYVGKINGVNNTDINITEETITSVDASYIFRSPIVKAKLTGFYTTIEDANEISFFFTQGSTTGFIQEVLSGVNKEHFGGELGIEAQVTPTIKLKGAASVGQYTYSNNPNLYVTSTSDDFTETETDANTGLTTTVNTSGVVSTSNLENYKVAGGPQTAYSIGFEYRDPNYWWFGATANFFDNAYIDVSPLSRSNEFYTDADGLPYNDYDPELAEELLKQEKFDSYMVINLVGGKSWKVGDKYIGFFASVGNLLDKVYKTGGYEQGRRADYRALRDDVSNDTRVFGSKYWYGRGANYFLNVYLRF
ncbi:carboxypeptidase-like regulatory domain-containing protein [Winogradskyella eckloniae]|uniref:carboxypeptidase regulatory-like domain-containing protein n=1 Tax=Winogradskyella eckloniae TaxID=1089306 RepID=UPI00156683BC|nr:carboxypeptidase regulatory-like domain-containing protein [Winogradskyella eckloniae]NRD18775.1 carboxypeptidase-like regulatory domain-containing protein [Winogradskyella eckloniae]